ncbi:MAG: hypothetical protein Q8Q17_01425 [bacterium]|nr:hypothetical protein [bacterium]
MKKHHGIQGPVLSANVEGLTNVAPLPVMKLKSIFTGFNKGIFLDPSDLAAFNGGQVEVANCNSYLVGNISTIFINNGRLNIKMSENISGSGHPPSFGKVSSGGEFLADLEEYLFAYIGIGGNGGGSKLFIQSVRYRSNGGILSVTLFPRDGKMLPLLNVLNLELVRPRSTSVTVMPPEEEETGSFWWRRPKPWLHDRTGSFPFSFA